MLQVEVVDTQTSHSTLYNLHQDLIRVGSAPDVECVLRSGDVLPEHVRIYLDANAWYARDAGSAAGTYVQRSGDDWRRLQGSEKVEFPLRLKVERFLLRVSADVAPSPRVGSVIDSIGGLAEKKACFVLDMCDSSSIAAADEKIAFHLKKRMWEIVQPRLKASLSVQTTGDGFLALFPAPAAALQAAKQVLADLDARNRGSANRAIRVRIALHTGKVYELDAKSHEIHGAALNLTFRIEGVQKEAFLTPPPRPLPKEDRILCSKAFLEDLQAENGSDGGAVSFGPARLKGFPEPVEIFLLP